MERSAIYRRALAPIMLFAGLTGLVAMGLWIVLHLNSMRALLRTLARGGSRGRYGRLSHRPAAGD